MNRAKMRAALSTDRAETISFTEAELQSLIPPLDMGTGSHGFGSYVAESRQLQLDDGKINWANGSLWRGFDFNDLDAVFSDITSFPFGI